MSMPTILIQDLGREQAVLNAMGSVALQEAALAHILNANGERLQMAVALTDPESDKRDPTLGLADLMGVNHSVGAALDVIRYAESELRAKLDTLLELLRTVPPPPPLPIPPAPEGWLIVFQVVDDSGNPLQGARFVAMSADPDSGVGDVTRISDADGYVRMFLPFGTFLMRETKAPDGFDTDKTTRIIITSINGATVDSELVESFSMVVNQPKTGGGPSEADEIVVPGFDGIYQPGAYCLTIYALSVNSHQPVLNASFRLTGNGVDKVVTTDDIGALNFGTLPVGTYTLSQEGTLSNWQPSPTHTVIVKAAGSVLPDKIVIGSGTVLLDDQPDMKIYMSRV